MKKLRYKIFRVAGHNYSAADTAQRLLDQIIADGWSIAEVHCFPRGEEEVYIYHCTKWEES